MVGRCGGPCWQPARPPRSVQLCAAQCIHLSTAGHCGAALRGAVHDQPGHARPVGHAAAGGRRYRSAAAGRSHRGWLQPCDGATCGLQNAAPQICRAAAGLSSFCTWASPGPSPLHRCLCCWAAGASGLACRPPPGPRLQPFMHLTKRPCRCPRAPPRRLRRAMLLTLEAAAMASWRRRCVAAWRLPARRCVLPRPI